MNSKIECKRNKGITLIALVVTIIVLLILAGVTISTLTGQNGILTQAEHGKIQTEIAKEKEEIAVAYNGAKIEKKGGEIAAEDINNQFNQNGTKAKARGNTTITVKFTESGRIYEIDNNGNIKDSSTDWEEYIISATMTDLYKYYVEQDTINGYELKNDGEDYISIESKEELKYLSEYTNLNNQTKNVTFVIMNDINLNEGITFGKDGSITGGTPENWIPIGKMIQLDITSQNDWNNKVSEYGKLYTSKGVSTTYKSWEKPYYYVETSFKGKIDGQGYKIEGMYTEGNAAGLVGVLESGTIENLIMSNNYLLAGEGSGVLVGKVVGEETTIKNIESKNNYIKVEKKYVGCINGAILEGNTNFENLHSDNTMIITEDGGGYGIGGIIGSAIGENCNFIECSNDTEIIGKPSEGIYIEGVAGILGNSSAKNVVFEKCYNTANIEGCSEGQGGIVGEAVNENTVIRNCYNTGDIGGSWGTGGILGFEISDYIEIYNCYNTGKIYNNAYSGGSLGGIIGQCRAIITMYNCYNAGEIYASEENYIYGDIGGLIGQNNEGTIYNCYNAGKINLYVWGEPNINSSSELGIGGLFGNVGSGWGELKISNCYNICGVVLNYPSNKTVERKVYFGNIVGSIYSNITIENCYGYTNKTINLPENACGFGQNIGAVDTSSSEDTEITKILMGYINKNDEDPSVGYKAEYVTQNVQEVENYQSQAFCNMLNNWVNSNNAEGKYSTWKYDINKNGGYPYLETLEGTIK